MSTDSRKIELLKDALRKILDRSTNDMGKRSKILDIRAIAMAALTDLELENMADELELALSDFN